MRVLTAVPIAALLSLLLPSCSALDDINDGLAPGGLGPDPDRGAACPKAETPDGCGVIDRVNEERAAAGLAPVRFDPSLARAARDHARDMAENDYFDHESLDGRDFTDRCREAGYQGLPAAENIAQGQRSAEEVMEAWMTSPGHRRNILAPNSNEIGVGLAENVWVQNFGRH